MNSLFTDELRERLRQAGVVAVLVVDEIADAVPLAKTLVEAGVDVMELTLRTPAALEALRHIKRDVAQMMCGIGTILTPEQVHQVVDAGAVFGVAPGMNRRVVEQAMRSKLPFAPGVATPSDIEAALEYGCRILKFFPAESCGGMPYLKNMAAPYRHLGLRFMPLGGINAGNIKAYLADPMVLALGGSWIAPREIIQRKDWRTIYKNAREARETIEQIRKGEA
ncbi:MAG TPA: bifunctional 4-hydroxy-2-oxoglutarate aldolase/2-dehydro-3-deoxy-phosphogluconate aldolase [Acidobacteriota bacterium]|nr:bifunctional 4-hydroxy-2-oxoglutarate aldolase/2-dehydro-3-deoxy-phosphogluconate aldolase [Acidobacteriota bacterium]